MQRFRSGDLDVLASVACLTEGVDVPEAEVCMLARGVSHPGAYLQAVGRVLRPAPGKTEALLIDLPGGTYRYGFPTDDRLYTLSGEAISRAEKLSSLRQCQVCGTVWESAKACPECGEVPPVTPPRVKIWGSEMAEVDQLSLTPAQRGKLAWKGRMMANEAERLAWFVGKGWPARRCAGVHHGLFGCPMPGHWWRMLGGGR
jgi:superfamily II DNA or RNA helicase